MNSIFSSEDIEAFFLVDASIPSTHSIDKWRFETSNTYVIGQHSHKCLQRVHFVDGQVLWSEGVTTQGDALAIPIMYALGTIPPSNT